MPKFGIHGIMQQKKIINFFIHQMELLQDYLQFHLEVIILKILIMKSNI